MEETVAAFNHEAQVFRLAMDGGRLRPIKVVIFGKLCC